MFRRPLATVAAGLVLAGLTPTAHAQTGDITDIVSRGIADADCHVLDPLLRSTFRIDGQTTRSGLSQQIRDAARPVTAYDPATYLLGAEFAGQIADKAVECGTVKPDPEFFPGSSIPDLDNIQGILRDLSSTLQPR